MNALNLPQIDNLKISDLRQLIELCEHRVTELQEVGRREAIDKLTTAASELGYDTLEALLGPRKRGRPRKGNGAQPDQPNL